MSRKVVCRACSIVIVSQNNFRAETRSLGQDMLPFPAFGHIIVQYACSVERLPSANSGAFHPVVATFSSLARPSYRFSHRMADTESRQDRSHPSGGCVTQRINRNQ